MHGKKWVPGQSLARDISFNQVSHIALRRQNMATTAKKIQLRLVGLAGALILAIMLVLTPQAAMAQSTCSGVKIGLEGETYCVDPMVWEIVAALIKSGITTPATAPAAPVSPLAPSAPVTGTSPVRPITFLVVTDLLEAQPVIAMDYAKDSIPGRVQEKAPTVPGQTDWCASFVSDAQKVLGYGISDAVYDCQLMAATIGAHTPGNISEMAQGIRYLVWVSNVTEHTMPTNYETVYFDGVSVLYLTTLSVSEMDGVTYSWAVAVK